MPFHNGWLPREGFHGDVVGRILNRTAFNPVLTLAVLLAAKYTKQGGELAAEHKLALTWIRRFFYYGAWRWATTFLDNGVLNNWKKDEYDWKKEIVIVTGGAGGIGGKVVTLLAERGIKVVVLDVIPMTYEAPANVRYYKCDITSIETIAKVATQIRAEVGEPTILINNAGVARGKSILDSTEKDVRFTFEVNTMAHYWLAKEFLPSMVKNDHGMIVTVASVAAYITVPNMVDYASSKAAAHSFHEGLTAELKTRYNAPKVRTVIVNQGYTKTPLFQGYNNDAGFLMPSLEPETVAEAIVKKVLSGTAGQVLVPEFATTLPFIRTYPHWMQVGMRARGENIMTKWNGRQVIDVEKWKSGAEKTAEKVKETVQEGVESA
ncbi:NAD(P)-binding protein [Dissoconium aciculare CBS 342.82]|jgi:short-subunit dehydrogenase|uniref:Short-chain dehydrogenase/reductase 3 n=1 Tax=Dissoconium aciculare CBS 342.82 TaxID=1314786 RepID=A0A6J3M3D5_9PEZI|nr:NAD(P)-binding protein [Dissoconium aciculare CBS 342.82]KAF1822019.1 NAD(P)-binding protein [Dissoconium aciculare CBS 342.82]